MSTTTKATPATSPQEVELAFTGPDRHSSRAGWQRTNYGRGLEDGHAGRPRFPNCRQHYKPFYERGYIDGEALRFFGKPLPERGYV